MKYYLSITMMFRNEACWLLEWIEYHRLLGVQYFLLFDHLSSDQPQLLLAPYIEAGIVKLIRIEEDPGPNFMHLAIKVYNQALQLLRGISRWVAMLDSDEFILPHRCNSLQLLLQDYEEYGGLVINWQMFGTASLPYTTAGTPMIQQLNRKGPNNLHHNVHIKSIVQPLRVENTVLHFATYQAGYYAVNINKERIEGAIDPSIPIDQIQLNHYFCRDERFLFEVKIARRMGLGMEAEEIVEWNDEMNVVADQSIARFIEPLKARLGYPVSFDWRDYARRVLLESNGALKFCDDRQAYHHWDRVGRFLELDG